ncbi:hypothetical protein F0562_005165 [Nyssa sinensis]|uniref:Uncharacterized protein n=1 Tax=Nyssa sinensis TaxID=561372 RepID=A0A5J5ALE4_9ASTE|nr:hypothetical protein F0562_005165 [Nyssa sinensis]
MFHQGSKVTIIGAIKSAKQTTLISMPPAIPLGTEDHHRNGLLSAIQRTLSKNSEILNGSNGDAKSIVTCDQGTFANLELALVKAGSDSTESSLKQKCSICSPDSIVPHNSCAPSLEESSSNGDEDNSMALVPVQKLELCVSDEAISVFLNRIFVEFLTEFFYFWVGEKIEHIAMELRHHERQCASSAN